MRVSAGIPRPIETSEPVGEGAIAQGRNRGAPPPPRTDAGRTASAGHHCHRDGEAFQMQNRQKPVLMTVA
jgi:hypothetical protein